jgi:hypothetical protein
LRRLQPPFGVGDLDKRNGAHCAKSAGETCSISAEPIHKVGWGSITYEARKNVNRRTETLPMKASLSESHRKLVEMMQNLNFGRIEGLQIRDGEPVLEPAPRLIRDIKLGGENGPRPELGHLDFALKSQVVELLEYFTELENCRIEVLEVKSGLPFRLVVEQLV